MSVLSVVLPAYNEELMIAKTCSVLGEVLTDAGISYELVLVNDGSSDRTWEEIEKAGKKDPNILGVSFICRTCSGKGGCSSGDGLRSSASPGNPGGNVPFVGTGISGDRRSKVQQRKRRISP